MLIKINIIVKLKMLKIYFLFLISKIKKTYFNNNFKFLYFYFIISFFNNVHNNQSYINNNLISLSSLNINKNLVKKIFFFKKNYLNLNIFYELIKNKISFYNSLKIDGVSNYNPKFLFVYYYYFILNVKLGAAKYLTSYYQNNLFFIKFFILKYLKKFVDGKNLYINLQKNNINILDRKILYKILLKKMRYLKFLKEINFKVKAFINLVLISLYSKDVILLKNGIKSILEQLHFKKHRRFLYNFKTLMQTLSYIFFYKFKCLGMYVKIKGKIGVGGNLKKRKFLFKLGSFSFTKKLQKLNYTKDSIRTYSGVLGFEMYLTYK